MERKIGEVFKIDKKMFHTERSQEGDKCAGCYFKNIDEPCNHFTMKDRGFCHSWDRTDKTNVIFKLVEMCEKKEEKRNVELTLEKAREWYQKGGELREVALQAFGENELMGRSHSWEEFCEKNNIDYNTTLNEHRPCGNILVNVKYPNNEYAKAAVALSQLLQLRQEWIGNWEPDWWGTESKYCIFTRGKFPIVESLVSSSRALSFPTEELALEFLRDFKDLLNIAKPLL